MADGGSFLSAGVGEPSRRAFLELDRRLGEVQAALATDITDHVADADPHPQYLTEARGDARYYTQSQVDLSLSGKSDTSHGHAYAATSHTHSYLPLSGGTLTGQLTMGTSASIRQASTTWTGNPGSGVGKIEYHSNRWYIVAGSNSTELLRVRQDGSDKFVIDNNGSISVGSVPWARLTGVPSYASSSHTHSYLSTGGGTLSGELVISNTAPQMKFNDTTSGADDFWIHVNGNRFYILADRDDNGAWDGAYPLELRADSNVGYVFGLQISTVGHTHSYASTSHTHSYLSTSGGSLSGAISVSGRVYCYNNSTSDVALYCDRNVDATGSYSNYHYGRVNAVFRNTNSTRAAANAFWTTSSTDRGVTYGIWTGEANRFRVTNTINSGYAYVNAAGFTTVSASFTKERIRTARDEDGDGLVDVVPADKNRAFELFQQLRPVIYDDKVKSIEHVWLGCTIHDDREVCFEQGCDNAYNTTEQEHDCDMDPDCGGTNNSPCPIYMEHYNKLHFIAEEVDEVYPHATSNRSDGTVIGIDHHVLATEHINVTQHLIDAVTELQFRVNQLEGAA